MEIFTVKFGTPKPLSFRENDNVLHFINLDLEARMFGYSAVSNYDQAIYTSNGEVTSAIQSNCMQLLQKCLDNWPKDNSVLREWKNRLAPMFDQELSNIGITAVTSIMDFSLTDESEKKHIKTLETVQSLQINYNTVGWDHPYYGGRDLTEKPVVPPGYYRLNYEMGFTSERQMYAPGEKVVIYYNFVATDTSYTFHVDVEDFKVDYGNGGPISISFTMPSHDVQVSVNSRYYMMPNQTDEMIKFDGWICPRCKHHNTSPSKFCPECGSERKE